MVFCGDGRLRSIMANEGNAKPDPSFDDLYEMPLPYVWGINTSVEDSYVRIYSNFELLYEYWFSSPQEAADQSHDLWLRWLDRSPRRG